MPTLIDVDGFNHRTIATVQGGSGFIGTYDTITGSPTIDTTTLRSASSTGSLKCIGDGATAQSVRRNIIAGIRMTVGTFYFKGAAVPNTLTTILSNGGGTSCIFQIDTNGKLNLLVNGGTPQLSASSICDGLWHLIDFKFDTSANPYLLDAKIDGTSFTQATKAAAAADQTTWTLGIGTPTSTATFFFSDFVMSSTSGDYPLGAHHVYPMYPNGSGTSTLGTTNAIVDEGGAQTTLYQHVDDWNGGTPDTSTYITYTSNTLGDAASNFYEMTFTDVDGSDTVVWGVYAYLAGFAASTTGGDTAACRIMDSHAGNTRLGWVGNVAGNTGLIDYSGSTTVLGYATSSPESSAGGHAALQAPSGGWSNTTANALVGQWGLSSDTAPLPRLSALMLEYVSPGSGVSTADTQYAGMVPI